MKVVFALILLQLISPALFAAKGKTNARNRKEFYLYDELRPEAQKAFHAFEFAQKSSPPEYDSAMGDACITPYALFSVADVKSLSQGMEEFGWSQSQGKCKIRVGDFGTCWTIAKYLPRARQGHDKPKPYKIWILKIYTVDDEEPSKIFCWCEKGDENLPGGEGYVYYNPEQQGLYYTGVASSIKETTALAAATLVSSAAPSVNYTMNLNVYYGYLYPPTIFQHPGAIGFYYYYPNYPFEALAPSDDQDVEMADAVPQDIAKTWQDEEEKKEILENGEEMLRGLTLEDIEKLLLEENVDLYAKLNEQSNH